ncbi:DJ-1/PfpI family protein [Bartonella sp. M0280]|uniref:DJ-1/PfpI family protein n=1 Tax=Bartonella apihabitans TaxID=2750929 RepID=UPI0018DDE418|nr:DJ-1/PfpI family protein [Bartonella apihabitans]MBI0168142.1 DJ-1/PfpI family protein [Bartonella apihabitans]
MTIKAGFFIFDEMQLLDFAAPYDEFCSTPEIEVSLIGETLKPITTTSGLSFAPDHDISTILPLDVLCIPGGDGVNQFINNEPVLEFFRKEAKETRFVTSVCTGSLILGASGLLKGRKATTHWSAMEFLPLFGAIPVQERVVVDGHIITAGGITAGMDFGLVIIAKLLGQETAKKTQLLMQYDPEPPFDCGTPGKAPKALVKQLQQQNSTDERRKIIRKLQEKHGS